MIELVREFLRFVSEEDAPGDRLERLEELLDRLALAYHAAPEGDVSAPDVEAPEPPEAFAEAIGRRFPGLGLYAWSWPREEGIGEPSVAGWALEDLQDIARDLWEVAWLWDHAGPDDAHWQFRFLYGVHWGVHLHGLRAYLHLRRFQ